MPNTSPAVAPVTYAQASEMLMQSPTSSVSLTILNGAAYAQVALAPPGQNYARAGAYAYSGEEKYLLPGVYTLEASDYNGLNIAAIKWRSAVASQLATVSASG